MTSRAIVGRAGRTWVAAGLAVFTFALAFFLEYSPDTPFHIAVGKLMIRDGRVPDRSDFLAAFQGREWVDHEWLFQLAVGLLYRLGDIEALIVMRLAVAAVILGLLWRACRGCGFMARCVAAALGLAVMGSRFMVRPELASLIFCLIFLHAIRNGSRIWLLALPAVGMLWANMHGYFIVGPALLLIAAVCPPRAIPRLVYLKAAMLVVVGSMVNPHLIQGCIYPLLKTAGALGAERGTLHNIVEMRSPFSPALRSMPEARAYLLLLVCALALRAVTWRDSSPFEWLVLLGAGVASGIAARNMGLFAAVATPTVAASISDIRRRWARPRPSGRALVPWLCGAALLLAARDMLSDRLYVRTGHLRRSGCGWSYIAYPRRGLTFLDDGPAPAAVLNNFETGSYILLRSYPRIRPVITANTDLCPASFIDRVLSARASGDELAGLAEDLGVECMFLAHQYTPSTAHAGLKERQDWALLYFDEQSAIWARRPAEAAPSSPAVGAAERPKPLEFGDETPAHSDRVLTALATIRLLPSRRPSAVMRMRFADFLQSIGLTDEAVAQARTAIRVDPENASARLWLGALLYGKGRLSEARIEFDELLRLRPRCVGVRTFLGLIAMSQDDAALGNRYWAEELEIRPRRAAEYSNRGLLCMLLGDYRRAAACFEEALKRDPSIRAARESLRMLEVQRQGLAAGLPSHTPPSIASLGPRASAKFWINLGAGCAANGRDGQALQCYLRAAKADASFGDAHYNAGNAQFRMGELDAAATSYRKAIARNPGDPEPHYRLGGVYVEQERYKDAHAQWQRVLQLSPSHAGVRRNLPLLLQKLEPQSQ